MNRIQTILMGAGACVLAALAALTSARARVAVHAEERAGTITIDYPLEGSVFPPEITPPTFLWHDPAESVTRWVVDVSFAGHVDGIRVETSGERMQKGRLDPQAGPGIELTP